jgi:pyrroline-5-carboxylate reductase
MHYPSTDMIVLLGGGHMGGALAMRWVQAGMAAHQIVIVEQNAQRRAALADAGFTVHASLAQLLSRQDVIVLAVKPQSYAEVKPALEKYGDGALMISIMAGRELACLPLPRRARVMPNLPAMLGLGVSACYAPGLAPEDRARVEYLFHACGALIWLVAEDQFHAVTAISGSGPAYIFSFLEAFEHAARRLGLEADLARLLVQQTAAGAVAMACQPQADAAALRAQVTSKGGTTEAALQVLLAGLPRLMEEAVTAAEARSRELASRAQD